MRKLTRDDLHRLRDRLSGRTDDDRRRQHEAFVAALEDFVAENSRPADRDGGTSCR